MANKTVTLYIDETSVKLMVAQGNQVKEWSESPLEPGLVENNIIVNETEVALKIKRLFENQKLTTKRVVVGMSGIRCLTRPFSLPRLPKEMLDEAVRREAQRVLPVPLEELYISWQILPKDIVPTPEAKMQVFLVGIPRKAADALHKTLQRAELKLGSLEIKPLILSRFVRETTAVIVDVQSAEFDIVVIVSGVPQPVRSVRFAGVTLSAEEQLAAIKNELNRTLSFYNSNNPDNNLAKNIPVYVSGELARTSFQPLAAEIGHPVSELFMPIETPEGCNPNHFTANIGLAYGAMPGRERRSTAINLNTTPVIYQTKSVSLANVLVLPGTVVGIGILVFLVLFAQNLSAEITTLNDTLSKTNLALQQKQAQRQNLSTKVAELQKNAAGLTSSHESLTKINNILKEQASATADSLKEAIDNLSQTLTLSNIRYVANILTINGKAPVESQIVSYHSKLEDSGQFGNIDITEIVRNASGSIDFTIVGTIQRQSIGANSMEVALGSLPATVILTGVNSFEDTISLTGTAPNSDKIFAYFRALEASQRFKEITISDFVRSGTGNMTFSLVLKTNETGE